MLPWLQIHEKRMNSKLFEKKILNLDILQNIHNLVTYPQTK